MKQAHFTIVVDLRPFFEAMEEAGRRLTEALKKMKVRRPPARPPLPHVFRVGDFDLRCRITGCGKGPEEH